MENKTPLTPKSAKTRQRLLMAAIDQIAAHGYHNVTVDDIARACGVSTGSAYRYFKNKKEMLLAAIDYSYANIQTLSGTTDNRLEEFSTPEEMLSYAMERFYLLHKKYYAMHEELEGLRHSDAEVRAAYENIRRDAVEALIRKCPEKYAALPNLRERLCVAIGILENCAHMQMDAALSEELDMAELRKTSIRAVITVIGG